MPTPIRCGQAVRIKPEWQDKGDDRYVWIATDDEANGRVTISPQMVGVAGWHLAFNPTQVVSVDMLERE